MVARRRHVAEDGVGSRTRAARERLMLSQAELAKRAGVSRQTILLQESQPDRVSRYLPRIAEALGVSESYLRYGIDQVSSSSHFEPAAHETPRVFWVPVFDGNSAYAWLRDRGCGIRPKRVESTSHSMPMLALELEDRALCPAQGSGYPEGTLALFVHTDNRDQVEPEQLVAVELPTLQQVIIRRVKHRSIAGGVSFVPDNPYYPSVFDQDGARVVGLVMELRTPMAQTAGEQQFASGEERTNIALAEPR